MNYKVSKRHILGIVPLCTPFNNILRHYSVSDPGKALFKLLKIPEQFEKNFTIMHRISWPRTFVRLLYIVEGVFVMRFPFFKNILLNC